MLLWFPFTDGENWGSKSWSNLCKFTWWESGRAGFELQRPQFSRYLLWGVRMDLPLAPAGTWSCSTVFLAKMSSCQPFLGAPSTWLMPHPHLQGPPPSAGIYQKAFSFLLPWMRCWTRSAVQIEHEFCWQGNNKAPKSALGLFALHILLKLHVRD